MGWVIDWRDVARWLLEELEREDPPRVERVSAPERDLRFGQRPWPASARRFQLTRAGERELARLRAYPDEDEDDDVEEDDELL